MLELNTTGRADAETERRAVEALESLEAVKINGACIELWHSEFSKRYWKPAGIMVRIYPECVWLGWLRPDTLGWFPGVDGGFAWNYGDLRGDLAYFHVTMYPGDHISIDRLEFFKDSDPTLSDADREWVRGIPILYRADGSVEHINNEITFTSPIIVQIAGSPFLIDPSVEKFASRLLSLKFFTGKSPDNRPLVAIDEAERRQFILENLLDQLTRGLMWMDIPRSFAVRIERSHDAAVAFGYALALAEAEVAARPGMRKVSKGRKKGGEVAGAIKKEKAEVWRKLVLEWAVDQEKGDGENWTRTTFAENILDHFGDFVPGFDEIYDWLGKHAEAPKGPLRSRRKGVS